MKCVGGRGEGEVSLDGRQDILKVILRLERGVGGGSSWLKSWGALGGDKDFAFNNEKLIMFVIFMCCDFTLIKRSLRIILELSKQKN